MGATVEQKTVYNNKNELNTHNPYLFYSMKYRGSM